MTVRFAYNSNEPLDESAVVKFASCFTNWQQLTASRDLAHNYSVVIDEAEYGLKPGQKVQYKFIVNGVWELSDDKAAKKGNLNHVAEIAFSPPDSAVTTGSKNPESSVKQRRIQRSNLTSSTASTVMILYNKGSPYSQFLAWTYASTFGAFFGLVKRIFGRRT